MNAPFHASRAASLRDPFSAFVTDEETAEMLRPIAVEHGWSPEKVNKGGLRNAVQTLSVSASPSILFVDLSESGDPLNDINALAEVCEPGTVVIAAGQVNDVRLYRDLVASGLQDYLLKLDIHFGTGALALDLEPGRGLTDAIENPSRIDGLFIERAMVRANEKLCVLSAEAPLNQPLLNDGSAFFQLQEELRNAFESTVLDLPRSMLVQHPHLVQDAHVVIVAVEFTLAATRDAIRVLSWL